MSGERVRLQKAISRAGLMSRRAAEELIKQGRIRIGDRVAVLGDRVDPGTEQVFVDGHLIPIAPDHVTYLVYKPVGIVSTASDPQGRGTIVDLVPTVPRVYPVGRLDADSEGLILLTNDGDLTHRVTHPSFGITKTYEALVEGNPGRQAIRGLTEGVELDDGIARAVTARVVDRHGGMTLVRLVMTEGRNREVRRMFDALGYPVRRLARTAIGPVRDSRLAPGDWRELTPGEVRSLLAAAVESRPEKG